MSWQVYLQLSLMMFLQFAVWGAWSPVLAARLLGPLKMSGKQTGWIYGTIYIGCIISPLIAGQIADRWVATQYFLAAAHLAGGILLLASARQRRFTLLFAIMLLYALAFAPTLALVNSLMFAHLTDPANQSFGVLLWGTVGWVVAGLALTFWRRLKGSGEGADCLVLAGALHRPAAGLYCLTLPHTPRPAAGRCSAVSQGREPAQRPQLPDLPDRRLSAGHATSVLLPGHRAVPVGIGRAGTVHPRRHDHRPGCATVATVLLAFYTSDIRGRIGFVGIFSIGIAMWLVMYAVYALQRPAASR